MKHLSRTDLLLALDNELDDTCHLDACPACQAALARLRATLDEAAQVYRTTPLPTPTRPAKLPKIAAIAAALLLLIRPAAAPALPQSHLTPGVVAAIDTAALCAPAADLDHNPIPAPLARQVFRAYGIPNPQPRAFEVDYLIPPDLGGALTPANLWPQPYHSGAWNARVKDALEDRLRTMVCAGQLPLSTAQQQIASNWVEAYRHHFRTNQPLPDHLAFVRDQPWE